MVQRRKSGYILGRLLFVAVLAVLPITASQAGWKEEVNVLKMGIVSDRERDAALRQLEPFRLALAREINMPVRVFIYKSYQALINAQESKRVHYAVQTAASFATAWARCHCIRPVAAAKLSNGSVKYRSVLIVKKDRFTSISDLKGRQIAVSSKKSLSGYIVPKQELDGKELRFVDKPGKYDDTVIVTAGTTSASRKLFQAGQVDGLFGWNSEAVSSDRTANGEMGNIGTVYDLSRFNFMGENELQIIWKSKPIFTGPHVLTNAAPDSLRTRIGNFLLNLYYDNPRAYDSVENYRGGGFAEVRLTDYQPLIDLVDAREKKSNLARSE